MPHALHPHRPVSRASTFDACAAGGPSPREIEQALADGRLELRYQPICDVRTGRLAGFEALLRWPHPQVGVLDAAHFLPAVEDRDLIVDIGDMVLADGCTQLARWQGRYGDRAPSLALNVAARQVRTGDLSRHVRHELERTGANPAGLCLELTDTSALDDQPEARADLARLRGLGVSIALDDFGTGHTSLHQLQEIAADILKIDRSFVARAGIDPGATAIVRAALDLGRAFDMVTVAEGVSTIEQLRLLASMGCDQIQGFLVAPAIPADLAEGMLDTEPPAGADRDVDLLRARGRLAVIDASYVPSEYEVAALAGVTAVDARFGMTLPND